MAARVQQLVPTATPGTGSSGWGIWATPAVDSFAAPFNIAVETAANGNGNVRSGTNLWANGDTIVLSTSTWYDVSLSIVGFTATATMTELDGAFGAVPGHTATITYTDSGTSGEMESTGMVGTRSAQNWNDYSGYVIDNFKVSVPEPTSLSLLALAGLGLLRRRRRA